MLSVIPAILVHSLPELTEQLRPLVGRSPLVQVDLAGKNYLMGEEAMPFWEEFDFEFDLMTEHPRADAEVAVALGASRVIIHLQNAEAKEALEFLQKYRGGEYPVLVGVAIPAHGSEGILSAYKGLYDYVQVMGIEREGFQGKPFDDASLALVRDIRAAHPALFIQVDGGVKKENTKLLFDAGANRVVVGSAYHEVSGK